MMLAAVPPHSKSSVLLVLMLLKLFSVSYQKTVKNTENGSDLNRRVSKLSPEKPEAILRRVQRNGENLFINPPSSTTDSGAKLKWQKWERFLPKDAIPVNRDKDPKEYICRPTEFLCKAGFYTEGQGKFCHYDNGAKKSDSFEILVNEDNFEDVEWDTFNFFKFVKNPIRICENENFYVGRNKDGLMVVNPDEKCFALFSGCAALIVNFDDVLRQEISDVHYSNEKKPGEKLQPEILAKTVVFNDGSGEVKKKVELSKKTTKTETWSVSGTLTLGIETKFEAGIPKILSGGIQVTGQVSLQLSKQTSKTEEISHSVSLEVKIQNGKECMVVMEGYPVKENIPFTARLTRIYKNNKRKTVSIIGTYTGSYVVETKAEVTQCLIKKVKG